MMLEKLRQEVYESLQELPKNHLVTMHSGTVSGRDAETGYIVIKPTGFRYDRLTPSDLLVMDSSGKILEGTLRTSSDTETHLYLYQHRSDIFGIVHTHSPLACIFAVLGRPILELMLNAANLSLVAFSRYTNNLDGQVFVFFVITVAAAEVAVGLAPIVALYRKRQTAQVEDLTVMKL